MSQRPPDAVSPEEILAFWFPADLPVADAEAHGAFWFSRMQGGMDAALVETYADVSRAAARGAYDHWAGTPRGRLALVLTLDQFPRSVWRDTPGAFGQDIKACRLALEALTNGHFDALEYPWEKLFYFICISHCEGPDHLARMDLVVERGQALAAACAGTWDHYAKPPDVAIKVREVIRRFGRHPHRNAVLGRISTPEEEAYVACGDFPHEAGRQKQG